MPDITVEITVLAHLSGRVKEQKNYFSIKETRKFILIFLQRER